MGNELKRSVQKKRVEKRRTEVSEILCDVFFSYGLGIAAHKREVHGLLSVKMDQHAAERDGIGVLTFR